MKRFCFCSVILAVMLALSFSLTSCDEGTTTIANGVGSQGGNNPGGSTPVIPDTDSPYFTFNSAKGTITGYTGPGGAVKIPSSISGVRVTAIGDSAFSAKQLTSVTIPDSVSDIRARAFINNPLTSVTIGSNVTMGFLAFGVSINGTFVTDFSNAYGQYGKQAGTYTRPDTSSTAWRKQAGGDVDVIPGDFLFDSGTGTITGYTGSGGAVVIPSSINGATVRAIGDGAFRSNPLTSVSIPDSVTSIGNSAFYNCAELTSVIIPESVTSIGAYSFGSGGSGNNVSFKWDYGAFDNCYALTSVTIPARLAGQFTGKFSGYSNLSVILTGTGGIPNGAFDTTFRQSSGTWSDCKKITSLTIGANVSGISQAAFSWLVNLEQINVVPANTTFSSVDGILYNKEQSSFLFIPPKTSGSITIPSGITSIGERAFSNRPNLTDINVDPMNGVYSSVEGVLLSKDKKLLIQFPAGYLNATYTIPSGVETIGSYAFEGCTKLTSVTIPNSKNFPLIEYITTSTLFIGGVSTIKSYAFEGCTDLTRVIITGSAIYSHNNYSDRLTQDLLEFYVIPSLTGLIKLTFDTFLSSNDRGFYDNAFPQGSFGSCGNALKSAYLSFGAGTYIRSPGGSDWARQ